MKKNGFTQIIDKATHKDGNILDHVYIRDLEIAEWQFHHPYYTDHDAICITITYQSLQDKQIKVEE